MPTLTLGVRVKLSLPDVVSALLLTEYPGRLSFFRILHEISRETPRLYRLQPNMIHIFRL